MQNLKVFGELFQSQSVAHIQNPLVDRSIQTEPQVSFLFKLIACPTNTGSRSFEDREIEFTIHEGRIQRALLKNAGNRQVGYTLRTIQRESSGSSIVLEDTLGLIRIILKAEETAEGNNERIYKLAINHPSNLYSLEPLLN